MHFPDDIILLAGLTDLMNNFQGNDLNNPVNSTCIHYSITINYLT